MSTDNTKPTLTVAIAQAIISQFKEKYFDSHVFIYMLRKNNLDVYNHYLSINNNDYAAADGQIALVLAKNQQQLNIEKIEIKLLSINILGNPSPNALWIKGDSK